MGGDGESIVIKMIMTVVSIQANAVRNDLIFSTPLAESLQWTAVI